MCGRSIRVPLLDGTVPPLPEPELNLKDQGLASALDKLAGLVGGSPHSAAAVEADPVRAPAGPKQPQPVALPEPIELEPVAAARPVVPDLVTHPVSGPPAVISAPAAPEQVLASLAAEPQRRAATDRSPVDSASSNRRLILAVGTLAAAGACFAAGFALGRRGLISESAPIVNAPVQASAPTAPVTPATPSGEPSLTGRISYIAADGEVRPDAGARILVVPEERSGSSRLAEEGFRAGADPADVKLAVASLRALGGEFVIAGQQGEYSLTLPQAGIYQVIILSRYQGVDGAAVADPAAMQLLSEYFERPARIAGESALHVSQFRYRGSGTSARDHTFERP